LLGLGFTDDQITSELNDMPSPVAVAGLSEHLDIQSIRAWAAKIRLTDADAVSQLFILLKVCQSRGA
jgi:hypothetical protein